MKRTDFQEVARMRVREAKILLDAGEFAGACYLVGYAVECALKSCVAKQVMRSDFPDKDLANKAFTHSLEKLLLVGGLGPDLTKERSAIRPWTLTGRR